MVQLCHFTAMLWLCHSGAALLVEAADMGNADAQYELGCRLRVEVNLPSFLLITLNGETQQSSLFIFFHILSRRMIMSSQISKPFII